MVVILFFKLIKLFTVFTNPPLHMSHRLRCPAAYPPKFKSTSRTSIITAITNRRRWQLQTLPVVRLMQCTAICRLLHELVETAIGALDPYYR